MASTDSPAVDLAAAARGSLPPWSCMRAPRREHVARVARLMEEWARGLRLPDEEIRRWAAAGWLHDALRDAPEDELRATLGADGHDLPGPVLHGPAAALRIESVDPEIAAAVRWHTIGHPELGTLGAALFLADYLEPGRGHAPERRSALRARMPRDLPEVLREVVRERLIRTLEQGRVLREEGVRWWNRLSEEAA